MNPERAEVVALTVLSWLAGDDEVLPVFLGSTGLDRTDLRERAQDPDLLASVLEFVTLDDSWVLDCAAATGLRPEEPFGALTVLSGTARTHWT